MGKLSKKYIKSKKRKTTRRVRVKRGGHEREDVPHYHLKVQMPSGKSIELQVLHAISAKATSKVGNNNVKSATIRDLKNKIISSEQGNVWDSKLKTFKPSWLMGPNYNPNDRSTLTEIKPFTLFWKGKALLDDNALLRDIIVDGERLPLFTHNTNPIIIVLDEDLEYPKVINTEVIKHEKFKDTPPDE